MISSGIIKKVSFFTFVGILLINSALSLDLNHSEIKTVNDDTRFTARFPDKPLEPFNKVRHVKGNYIFTAGERVSGDRLIVTYLDETQFTKAEDIEVELVYPAKGTGGSTISFIEIYADLSSDDANAYFFEGGINKKFASILLECNQTRHFTYEIFIYGY